MVYYFPINSTTHVQIKQAVTRYQCMGGAYFFVNVLRTGISIIWTNKNTTLHMVFKTTKGWTDWESAERIFRSNPRKGIFSSNITGKCVKVVFKKRGNPILLYHLLVILIMMLKIAWLCPKNSVQKRPDIRLACILHVYL